MNEYKRFGSMIINEEMMWFITFDDVFPALYKMNLMEKKIECLGEIPWEDFFDENALIEKIDETIIIAPRWHKKRFLKYNMELSIFQSVLLEQEVWTGDISTSAFSNVIRYKNSLFFIGNKNGLIVEYFKDDEQFYIRNLDLPKGIVKQELSFFWDSAVLKDSIVYLAIENGGLFEINLLNFQCKYREIDDNYKCFSMTLIDDCLWITPYYGNSIIRYNLSLEKYSSIKIPIELKKIPFMTIINFGDEILLIPMEDEKIFCINKFNKKISSARIPKYNKINEESVCRQFLAIYRDTKGNTYLQKNGSFDLWIFYQYGKFEKISISIPFENIIKNLKNSKAVKQKKWTENQKKDLEFILWILKNCESNRNIVDNKSGMNIWKFLKLLSN